MNLTQAYSPSLHRTSHCCFSVSAGVVCMKKTSTSASQSRTLMRSGLCSGKKKKSQVSQHPGNSCLSAASTRASVWEQRGGKVLFSAGNQARSSNLLFYLRLSTPNANRHSCSFKPSLCQAISRQAMTRTGTGGEPSSCHYYQRSEDLFSSSFPFRSLPHLCKIV